MAPSYSGVWKLQTKYQYSSEFPIDTNLEPTGLFAGVRLTYQMVVVIMGLQV